MRIGCLSLAILLFVGLVSPLSYLLLPSCELKLQSEGTINIPAYVVGQAVWSPDNSQLAFVSCYQNNYNIYLYDIEANILDNLSDKAGFSSYPHWLSETSIAYFHKTSQLYSGEQASSNLEISDIEGESLQAISDFEIRINWNKLLWSPGNDYLLTAVDFRTYLIKLENGEKTLIAHADLWGGAWSPSGDLVAMSEYRQGPYEEPWLDGAYILNPSTMETIHLSQYGGDFSWAPDGNRLAYITTQSLAENYSVTLVEPDNTTRRNIAHDSVYYEQLQWSPDGRFLAFMIDGGQPGSGIFYWEAETDELVYSDAISQPWKIAWSPQNQLWAEGSDGTFVISPETGEVSHIQEQRGLPVWSPDGSAMVIRCGESLCIADEFAAQFIRIPVEEKIQLDWISWSGDSQYIAFQTQDTGRLVTYLMTADGMGLINLTERQSD